MQCDVVMAQPSRTSGVRCEETELNPDYVYKYTQLDKNGVVGCWQCTGWPSLEKVIDDEEVKN